jgi:hypothetical protein
MSRYDNYTTFDKLLAELGVPHGQFPFEIDRFTLSPRKWFEKRMRALGWVKVGELPKCDRACCR